MKPLASLSIDLDNEWSYLKTHGDPGWERLPSYLPVLAPRLIRFLDDRSLRLTAFVVGQDAAEEENHPALRSLALAGHEIGNHSFRHEPWIHLYDLDTVEEEIARAEEAILVATGVRPLGYRGAGFSHSPALLAVLARRGYRFDASLFPSFIGPLARAYYFLTARLSPEQRARRKALFGSVRDGLQPLKPFDWSLPGGATLLEIPVTTMPVLRLPIHASYLLYLSRFSPGLARLYWAAALDLCRLLGVEPSLLLHPLDLLGADDVSTLSFFPGMDMPSATKLERLGGYLDALCRRFDVVPMGEHAAAIQARGAGRAALVAGAR
jgi:hypothetical protein